MIFQIFGSIYFPVFLSITNSKQACLAIGVGTDVECRDIQQNHKVYCNQLLLNLQLEYFNTTRIE